MSLCTPKNEIDCPCDGLENLFVNATYFVDSFYGNDATAIPRDMSHPYSTIAAALALVQPNEVVYVQPGTYSVPSLTLNGSIWYFSQGSTITTNVTGFGFIYGYGNFIGQSPAITFTDNVNQMVFYAQSVTTPAGHAIEVSGVGRSSFSIRLLTSNDGVLINGTVACSLVIDDFFGDGIFINANVASDGRLYCDSLRIRCGTMLQSQSNSLQMTINSSVARSDNTYLLNISDPSSNFTNTAAYNISINRVVCSGLVTISGLASVTNVLQQPNLNLNIQNITSINILPNPIIMGSTSFFNLTYDTFAFTYSNPIPYIIVLGDVCIMHMDGARTYNSSQGLLDDVGFVQISSVNFSAIRCSFTEFFLTSQLVECNGNAEAQFDIVNFTNICQTARNQVVNNSQCIMNVQKMMTFYPAGQQIITNNGMMQLNIGAWQAESEGSQMINNTARMQVRIGFFVTSSSNNIMVNTTGTILGLTIGSIRMDGNNNTGLLIRGPTLMEIGQILGNNSGCTGILVEDPGQLYGRISRIMMQDQSCMEFRSSQKSNITFDWMTNQANSYVIYVDGRGEITLSGSAITAAQVKYPVFVVTQNSKFNMRLVRMEVEDCGAGIYIQASNSDVRIAIQHFMISNNAGTAAIYANSGTLSLEGNYYMNTGNNVPLIGLDGDATLRASLTFVKSTYNIIRSSTSGDIWYEASESITDQPVNNIDIDLPNPSQIFTVKGLFKTPGDYNVAINSSAPSFIRALDCIFVSGSRNILSPSINIICNYAIGNAGVSGGTVIPAGGFVVDGGIQ